MFLASVLNGIVEGMPSSLYSVSADLEPLDTQAITDRAETSGLVEMYSHPAGAVDGLQATWVATSGDALYVDQPRTLSIIDGFAVRHPANDIIYRFPGLIACGMSLVPGEVVMRSGTLIKVTGFEEAVLIGPFPKGSYLPSFSLRTVLWRSK